ncbi:MAG: hypothetical protein ACRDNJ_15410 [Solirubrobacteraceae bacterium]
MVEECGSLAQGWFSPSLKRSPCLLSPGALARTAARIRRLDLDRRLARGEDPSASMLLAARAVHLACPVTRRRLARALERFALSAAGPLPPLGAAPLRGAVAPNRDAILELADRLRRSGLLYARGIAALELILIDGSGPAYSDPRGEGLARQLQLASEALAG